MPKRTWFLIGAALLALAAAGCERLPDGRLDGGVLALKTVAPGATIPAEYGRLVSVTSNSSHPGWAQLWFERDDRSIVTVFVNYQNGGVRDKILVIPRS
jgi:hypothetical protein